MATVPDLAKCQSAVVEYGSINKACKALGIPRKTMQKFLKTGLPPTRGAMTEPTATVELDPEAPVSRDPDAANLTYYRRRSDYLEKECARLQDSYHIMGETFDTMLRKRGPAPAVKPYVQPAKRDLADEELTMIFISDVHVGEKVVAADTAGMSTYSLETFVERCQRYKDTLSSLVDGHLRKVYPLRKAFVPILGDITTGEDVFPMQPARIDRLLQEQITEGAYHLSELLRFIAGMFEEVWVYMVPGNHGGTKTTTLNADRLCYTMMAMALRNQENLHPIISDSPYCGIYVDKSLGIMDWPEDAADECWNLLFMHGQQARGWGGIPYYGLDRVRHKITTTTGIVWDKVYAGHHHTAAETAGWTLVGSWVGGTDYSMGTMQAVSRPTQLIQGLHPKMGPTWSFDVYLGDQPKITKEHEAAPGVYTPHNGTLRSLGVA